MSGGQRGGGAPAKPGGGAPAQRGGVSGGQRGGGAPAQRGDSARPGTVYLAGAGPGDARLLTARALELIESADVIVYDRLIPPEALDGARADAELLYVGKQGGGPSVPQEETEGLILRRARAGASVLRLKGGDPFVFGRGGEEALALRAAGISYEIVPGVTAGVAAAAYAGIPVTHRGLSTAVALVTGHTRADEQDGAPVSGHAGNDGEDGAPGLDWRGLAGFPGTLVFYMGVRALPEIARSLIEAGRDADEPVAVVERGTLPGQRTVSGPLREIGELALASAVKAPAVSIVGAVAGLADELAWLAPGPLAGQRIAVTRARAQASSLAARLRQLGAEVVQAPAIRIAALPGPPLDPSGYDLVCLTSPNGVRFLFERIVAAGLDARALAGAKVAAIGPGTAAALAEHGIRADVVPERFVAESLVEALAGVEFERALVARAAEARDVLPEALRERGKVEVLALYETVAEPLSPVTLAAAARADWITFTSSSTVRLFLEAASRAPAGDGDGAPGGGGASEPHRDGEGGRAALAGGPRIASIGPVTSATLREHGLEPDLEAQRHDVDGLIEALVRGACPAD
ncbi:MAG: uroporphyrinogen-III C-methyltransferase [Solirubrobacteraceae bacterium]